MTVDVGKGEVDALMTVLWRGFARARSLVAGWSRSTSHEQNVGCAFATRLGEQRTVWSACIDDVPAALEVAARHTARRTAVSFGRRRLRTLCAVGGEWVSVGMCVSLLNE